MQREHIVVLPSQDLVAGLQDQPGHQVVEPPTRMIGVGRRLFQYCIGGDHLPRDQVLADAEMLQRALGLRSPQLVSGHLHHAQTVGFSANFGHGTALRYWEGLQAARVSGMTESERTPCAPWISTPSMSAVAEGPVWNEA